MVPMQKEGPVRYSGGCYNWLAFGWGQNGVSAIYPRIDARILRRCACSKVAVAGLRIPDSYKPRLHKLLPVLHACCKFYLFLKCCEKRQRPRHVSLSHLKISKLGGRKSPAGWYKARSVVSSPGFGIRERQQMAWRGLGHTAPRLSCIQIIAQP